MVELELERTYLAAALPADIAQCRNELIQDVYVPETVDHALLRLRKRGNRHVITKKIPIDSKDSTRQREHTIPLSKDEYDALALCSKKRATKRRYYCSLAGHNAEVDVYQDELAGLVIIDFEFSNEADMDAFVPPPICLADVSQEAFAAGGKLAGRRYKDIEPLLQQYAYKPLILQKEHE